MFATGLRTVGFTIVWPEGVIFGAIMTYHVQFLLLVLAGWVNRQQQDVIDYLREENRGYFRVTEVVRSLESTIRSPLETPKHGPEPATLGLEGPRSPFLKGPSPSGARVA